VSSRPRRTRRLQSIGLVALPLVAVLAITSGAGSASAVPAAPAAATLPTPPAGAQVPSVTGYPAVAQAPVTAPTPPPVHSGLVAVNRNLHVATDSAPAAAPAGVSAAAAPAVTSRAAVTAAAAPAAAAAVAPVTSKVGLRALVLATDPTDFGADTWKSTLDSVGAAYDVVYARTTALTSAMLVRPDGAGKYNAILLASNALLYQDATGGFVSALTPDQWNLLWAYERDFGVRQATLFNSNGTFPEDYCLRASTDGAVGATPLNATLTAAGSVPFSYLRAGAQVPIVQSYVYQDTLAAGCTATAILTSGGKVLGALSPSTDGRERISLTFTSNLNLLQSKLLVYGLFRWASRGLFLGEQRHFLNIDVDDWFNVEDELLPNGTYTTWQMTAHDAYNDSVQQSTLRFKYPLASGLTMGMAFNGGLANTGFLQLPICWPFGGVAQLTMTTKCLRGVFRWINHTLTHPAMNFTDYATNYSEISQNLAVARTLGLPVDGTVLKTPEYSGLGTYNPNPNDAINPPTDFGLGASNPALLQASKALGVKYLHGNMSFKSQVPSCFNCGIVHPLEPSITVVPDWPTNIAYFSSNQAEETYFYNLFYGPNGKFPFWPTNLTYPQLLDAETSQALTRLAGGSVYTTTFHTPNLRDYGSGHTLVTDWADQLLAKYSSYYSVPVLTPGWPALAQYASARTAHFGELSAGVDAVYDRTAHTVTVTTPTAGSVTVTGARTAGFTSYGNEVSAKLTLSAGTPVVFTPTVLP